MIINLNMACRENGWLIRKTESLFRETGVTLSKIGASLTTTNDILGRSFACVFHRNNGKLTNINLNNMH
jgi:hypothetical protein